MQLVLFSGGVCYNVLLLFTKIESKQFRAMTDLNKVWTPVRLALLKGVVQVWAQKLRLPISPRLFFNGGLSTKQVSNRLQKLKREMKLSAAANPPLVRKNEHEAKEESETETMSGLIFCFVFVLFF